MNFPTVNDLFVWDALHFVISTENSCSLKVCATPLLELSMRTFTILHEPQHDVDCVLPVVCQFEIPVRRFSFSFVSQYIYIKKILIMERF